jgi:plasmid stabilization system protein ParE
MTQLVVTEPADRDIQEAFEWWRDHRSSEEAARWYDQIVRAIETLREAPERCPLARESELHPKGLRELHFGVSRRPTHRIVFTIDGDTVIVLRVRHSARRDLTLDDLP